MAFEGIGTATAMPVVARELDALASYTWAFNAFIVASLLAMVLSGLWSDAEGPRGPILSGILAFALGSLVAGLAPNLPVFVVGRALQGVGTGAVIVGVYVLIARAYPESLRPKAFSALATAWVLPSILGPVIAGWLADNVTWRAVFALMPLFIIPPLILILPRLGGFAGGTPPTRARQRIVAGVVATIGLFLVQDGALRESVLGLVEACAGIASLLAAGRHLLPTGALRFARGLPATVMMRGLIAAAYFSAEVFVPLALVQIRGVSTTFAGLALATGAGCWALGSLAQSRINASADRSGPVRIGALVVSVSVATLMVCLLPGVPPWTAALSWAAAAFGMGLSIPSIAVQTMRLSPAADQGLNSSALQIVDSVLVVIGTALVGAVYASAERGDGATANTFVVMWGVSAAVALTAVALAPRMRPATA